MSPSAVYVECPRDSWQGLHRFIPTEHKVEHLALLLEAGFTSLDCGSFVSPRAVPQMADTEAVLEAVSPYLVGRPDTDLLCIVANERGLERARAAKGVTSLGYPLSISDTFQRRNTNRSLRDSWPLVARMREEVGPLRLVVYLSMGFGNPYGDPWSPDLALEAVGRLRDLGVRDVALADTLGQADARLARELVGTVVERFGPDGIGVHLHARPEAAPGLASAALDAGARWLEGALGGVGGCPFAGDELVGNLPTEAVLPELERRGLDTGVNGTRLEELAARAQSIQDEYA